MTGSLGGLVQASAVNVLQGLATSEVKGVADSLGSEEARAALQAVVGNDLRAIVSVATDIRTISVTPPVAMGASGSQSGITI